MDVFAIKYSWLHDLANEDLQTLVLLDNLINQNNTTNKNIYVEYKTFFYVSLESKSVRKTR